MGLSFKVFHRPGSTLGHADAISRPPEDLTETTKFSFSQPQTSDVLLKSDGRRPLLFKDGALTDSLKSSPAAGSIDLVSHVDLESSISFSDREIIEAQQNDEICKLWFEYRKPNSPERNLVDFGPIKSIMKHLVISEGIVHLYNKKRSHKRIVLPSSFHDRVFNIFIRTSSSVVILVITRRTTKLPFPVETLNLDFSRSK